MIRYYSYIIILSHLLFIYIYTAIMIGFFFLNVQTSILKLRFVKKIKQYFDPQSKLIWYVYGQNLSFSSNG